MGDKRANQKRPYRITGKQITSVYLVQMWNVTEEQQRKGSEMLKQMLLDSNAGSGSP